MIERLTAESGEPVLRVDGRLMASRIDPKAEARAWVDQRISLLADVRTVIVLGLGAGYHVLEILARTNAQIVVIEPREDLVAAPAVELDPKRVRVEWCETVDAASSNDNVRRALRASYLILPHPASRGLAPAYYRGVVAALDGRSPQSLDFVWSLRGHASLGEVVTKGDGPLTIYDLAQDEVIARCDERERALIKALRELVK